MSKYKYIDDLVAKKEEIENEDLNAYVEAKVAEYREVIYAETKQAHELSMAQINLKLETAYEFVAELEREAEQAETATLEDDATTAENTI